MFFSSSTHIAKPCFNFKTSLRHSFWPFSKLIETCDTLFSHFQNHLALAPPFSPPFDFKTPRCNPAKPCFHSEMHFRNLRNLVSFSKHPFATQQNPVSISKPTFATRDSRFQNRFALSHVVGRADGIPATGGVKTGRGCIIRSSSGRTYCSCSRR